MRDDMLDLAFNLTQTSRAWLSDHHYRGARRPWTVATACGHPKPASRADPDLQMTGEAGASFPRLVRASEDNWRAYVGPRVRAAGSPAAVSAGNRAFGATWSRIICF